jgi:ribose 5-phosphate isomerase B
MMANRFSGRRAGVAWNAVVAEGIRLHNNANVLCLPADYVSDAEAYEILHVFLETDFEGGRHERRIEKMMAFDAKD